MGKFFKGLFFGGILGVGLTWFTVTKKGRKVRGELMDHAAVLYEQIKERLLSTDAWKKMKKNEYVALVRDMVEQYIVKTGIAADLKELLVKILSTQWPNVQKQLPRERKTKNTP